MSEPESTLDADATTEAPDPGRRKSDPEQTGTTTIETLPDAGIAEPRDLCGPTEVGVSHASGIESATEPGDSGARGAEQRCPSAAQATQLSSFGDYELLEVLGRGGMGVVYRARQISLGRLVALKLIKSGDFASENELLRFQNEVEAVAQLDHPSIVPVYEVGEIRGQRYFSMRLINGKSLDKSLVKFALDPRASARLVAAVASAVHHAHERGILHRDLKPGNILLDEAGEPHVTDFGLAKRLEVDSNLTLTGAILGTPAFMSPEQAKGSKGAITTATDVYGLGTILYALLTARAPFSASDLAELLDMVRARPPLAPTRLNARVPRDLEVICLKCLEKDQRRRYSSAQALADDLERWLADVPIAARKVGPVTRAWLWCRRNRLAASLAALLGLACVSGLAGVFWNWREAVHARATSDKVNELLTKRLLAQASPEFNPRGADMKVSELLDRASGQLGGWLDGQPDVEAAVRETLGGAYLSLGQYAKAEPHLRAAVRLDSKLHGPQYRDTLRATTALAALFDAQGRRREAEPLIRTNWRTCLNVLGPNDPITLDAAERLGLVLWHLGKLDEAASVLRQLIADRRRVFAPEHGDTLRVVYELSRLLRDRGKLNEATTLANQYEHDIRCARGPNHPDNVLAITNQADVCRDQGNRGLALRLYERAAAESRRILGPEHPSTREAVAYYSRMLRAAGRPAEAERVFDQSRAEPERPEQGAKDSPRDH
jgi:tetratricopeptide (TPR) repeat protein